MDVTLDRQRAGLSGVTTAQVAGSLVAATSSSRFVVPNYWADPASGIGYQVQVEIPPFQMNSLQHIGTVPIKDTDQGQILLRDMAQIRRGTMPGEYDRYNMTRLVSITANIEGADLGRVAVQIPAPCNRPARRPRGWWWRCAGRWCRFTRCSAASAAASTSRTARRGATGLAG